MARIINAGKVEVLREIEIEEYGVKVAVRLGTRERAGTITIEMTDPRKRLLDDLTEVLDDIDAVDEDTEAVVATMRDKIEAQRERLLGKWGDDVGKVMPYRVQVWVDEKISNALANVFGTDELRSDVASTIREALSPSNDTKGF